MANPSVQDKTDKFCQARDKMKALMEASVDAPHEFTNKCEELFSDFRLRCIHLRNEREALDNVADKDVAWRFICRFAKECPFHNNRCIEVLRILLLSDAWLKAFLQDPDVDVDQLPTEIAGDFGKRLEEVKKSEPDVPGKKGETNPFSKANTASPRQDPKAKDPKARRPSPDPWSQEAAKQAGGYPSDGPSVSIGGMSPLVAKSMSFVVQRCASAKLSSDDASRKTIAIGPGLVVSVSVADGATEEGVKSAARFVLTAPLSAKTNWFPGQVGDKFGGGAESVVSLCKRGEHQGVMVIPQPSLISDIIADGLDLGYSRTTKHHEKAKQMYDLFVGELQSAAPELVEKAVPKLVEKEPRRGLGGLLAGLAGGSGTGASATVPEIAAGEFGGNHYVETKSAGPFTHSFAF